MLSTSLKNPKGLPWPVLAIGNFDGAHRGHRTVFEKVIAMAHENQGTPMALTFQPHPAQVLRPKKNFRLLTPLEEKLKHISSAGIERIICEPFNQELANLSPKIFVKKILVDRLEAMAVWVGPRFFFGKNRTGNIETLRELGSLYGFSVHIMDTVKVDGEIISSTRVRLLIESGDLEVAKKFLGRPYSIKGIIIPGRKVGSFLGFPTANIRPKTFVIPARGVYACQIRILNNKYFGVTNVGLNPTFNRNQLRIETHILDFDLNVYGESAEVFFIQKIRNEKKFPSADALILQIREDIDQARIILSDLFI